MLGLRLQRFVQQKRKKSLRVLGDFFFVSFLATTSLHGVVLCCVCEHKKDAQGEPPLAVSQDTEYVP